MSSDQPSSSKPERKFVKISELRPGPILHASLPPDLLRDIRDVYEQVGRYATPTLEVFEVALMRDQHVAGSFGLEVYR